MWFHYWVDLRSCRTWRESILHHWKALGSPNMILRLLNLQKYWSNPNTRHIVDIVFIVAWISPNVVEWTWWFMGSSFSFPWIKAVLSFADIPIKSLIFSATLLFQLAFKLPPYDSHITLGMWHGLLRWVGRFVGLSQHLGDTRLMELPHKNPRGTTTWLEPSLARSSVTSLRPLKIWIYSRASKLFYNLWSSW
jgi:hypothetical protein